MYQTACIYLLLGGNLRQMSLGELSFQAVQHIHLDTGELYIGLASRIVFMSSCVWNWISS